MISENTFWELIEKSNTYSSEVGSIEQDNFLINEFDKKSIDEMIQFQIHLLKLRKELDLFETIRTTRILEYNTSRDTFERFYNGIIASGKEFYYKAKNDYTFLRNLLETNPDKLQHCYYEGFSQVAPAAFYTKTDFKGDWDKVFEKNKKEMTEQQILELKDTKLDQDLER